MIKTVKKSNILPMGCFKIVLPALAFMVFTLVAGGADAAPVCAEDRLLIQGAAGPLSLKVEIADTDDTRARGLMFRQSLPPGQGMLFIYPQPTEMAFWMRNTLIPLDIIFIDDRGVIRHIHPNARPLDKTPIRGAVAGDPTPERQMVLEIGGGEAARLGLRKGQLLAHPRLDPTRAAWPCD